MNNSAHDESSKIQTIADYFMRVNEVAQKLIKDESKASLIVYRGHSNNEYQLIPSLFRDENKNIKEREAELLREIEATHPREFVGMNTIDKLALLQHYQFPTRIMDFTFDPLVALFFAVESLSQDNGAVVVCRIPDNDVKEYDDEAVITLANLAQLSKSEQCELKEKDIRESFDKGRAITWDGLPSREPENTADKFVKFLLEDMPRFNDEKLRDDFSLSKPVFVRTKQFNPRIVAQRGAFLLFGKEDLERSGISIEKIVIRSEDKCVLRAELKRIGISNASMFPEFEHFLTSIRDENKRN